jgi:lipopolysaccharide transport system permease protein
VLHARALSRLTNARFMPEIRHQAPQLIGLVPEMSDLPVTVYTPESPLRRPWRMVRDMIRALLAGRELAWRLFLRDTQAKYRQSVLGYFWVFMPPLVASLPFVYLNSRGIIRISGTPISYGAYAIISTIIWQVFVDALNAPLRAVSAARPMLTRINLPHEAILMSALLQVGFGFLVRLVLLLGVLLWFRITPPPTAILFPLGILALVLVGFVLGLLITPLGVLYGDVQQGLPIATTGLMFLTPVLYPMPQGGIAGMIVSLNPVTPLITTTRDWLITGSAEQISAFAVVTGAALACLLVGWVVLRIAMPHLIARIGN